MSGSFGPLQERNQSRLLIDPNKNVQINPGDGSGILDEIDDLCDTDSTSYPTAKKIRRVNTALERVVSWLIQADGVWQFDDSNFTTVPEGTTDLVTGQSDYSFSGQFLDVEWVKVKDSSGFWHILDPIDQSQLDHPIEDFLITNGFPTCYDKQGDTIRLLPAPDATSLTLTGGMKVGFKRTGSTFTISDTIKQPGFASPFHIILAYMASIPYCAVYQTDRVAWLLKEIGDNPPPALPSGLKAGLINFYSQRDQDTRKAATMQPISHR